VTRKTGAWPAIHIYINGWPQQQQQKPAHHEPKPQQSNKNIIVIIIIINNNKPAQQHLPQPPKNPPVLARTQYKLYDICHMPLLLSNIV
jgi:hypothetical protein